MAAPVENVLIDLDGVIYQGARSIAGARDTLAWLEEGGIPHRFVTNTSSRPRQAISRKLAGMGIEVATDRILAPPALAADWLRRHVDLPIALFVAQETWQDFSGLSLLDEGRERGAGAVVLGDLGTSWDFAALNRAFRLLMDDHRPPLIALGMTRYWRVESGLQLDVGPFVRALEYAAGCESVVLGKPSADFFLAALAELNCDADSTLMIGDDLLSDVVGAEAVGIRGALVKTGKFRPEDLADDQSKFTVFDSIADLPVWWEQQ